jgi:hypothetical protein
VKIYPIIADAGRPSGTTVNLLNAGWAFTTAIPLPDGGYTLPSQVLAVFVEAPWDQLNRPHKLVLELVNDEGKAVCMAAPPGKEGAPLRIEHEIVVAPVPGAPNGVPGVTTFMVDMPVGTIRIPTARHRYVWKVTIGDNAEVLGFWVNAPISLPTIGGFPGTPAVPG